jgi:myo-inositol-1(or 4)-monophosphatase
MPGEGDLELLVAAAREAAELALSFFGRDPRSWAKGATSVVSEADFAVDRLLVDRLRPARPDYGWLSEESADSPDRLARQRVFVVDPIDGTRAFLSGRQEWCISLAVVEAGRPIAAALLAPVLGRLFRTHASGGADMNGSPLTIGCGPRGLTGARLAGPRRFARPVAEAAGIHLNVVRFVPSLAYRLALVACGEIDVAISGPNAHDWDIAAADLLVHEAGGAFTDLDGKAPRYNLAEITHPVLVAAAAAIAVEAIELIRAARDEESETP